MEEALSPERLVEYLSDLLERFQRDSGLMTHFFADLAFHIFVVVVGVLILSGAVNTSMIGDRKCSFHCS